VLSATTQTGGLNATAAAARYISSFQSYLTDTNQMADTNLVEVLLHTYAGNKSSWPPPALLGGNSLSANLAIQNGLAVFRKANQNTQNDIENESRMVGDLADSLHQYQTAETDWQAAMTDPCAALAEGGSLKVVKQKVDEAWQKLLGVTNSVANPRTNLTAHYTMLVKAAMDASATQFQGIANDIPEARKTIGLFADINLQLQQFEKESAEAVRHSYDQRSNWLADLDRVQMAAVKNGSTAHEARWSVLSVSITDTGTESRSNSSALGLEGGRFV